ncbi:hypothetical protein [Candidatus Poriferisodalis sp.]|uniref:hypothetical protein n=1 Tax=Candidatus Poriferisodalis sp. TaxID=3101277 RepID=UPI003B013D42
MALDIALGACDDLYDVAIVVSGDTDLIPALEYARRPRGQQFAASHALYRAAPSRQPERLALRRSGTVRARDRTERSRTRRG